MKEMKIRVTKTTKALNGEWAVLFATETTASGREITFCAIRHGTSDQPYSGCSVKHPNDSPKTTKDFDPNRGMHDSFKRAVEALVNDRFPVGRDSELITDPDPKYIESRFRGAFWIAMGRPGYARTVVRDIYAKMRPVGLVVKG